MDWQTDTESERAMTTFTSQNSGNCQQFTFAEHLIRARRLLNKIEELTACPSNTKREQVIYIWNQLIDEVKAMGVDIERIEG